MVGFAGHARMVLCLAGGNALRSLEHHGFLLDFLANRTAHCARWSCRRSCLGRWPFCRWKGTNASLLDPGRKWQRRVRDGSLVRCFVPVVWALLGHRVHPNPASSRPTLSGVVHDTWGGSPVLDRQRSPPAGRRQSHGTELKTRLRHTRACRAPDKGGLGSSDLHHCAVLHPHDTPRRGHASLCCAELGYLCRPEHFLVHAVRVPSIAHPEGNERRGVEPSEPPWGKGNTATAAEGHCNNGLPYWWNVGCDCVGHLFTWLQLE